MLARLLVVLAVATLSLDTFAGPSLRNGEGFAISSGVKIWYRVEGASRPGVPILIIHGGPGETARPFERTIGPLLALSRPVIYTDYRGAGRSDRPAAAAAYSFDQLADDQEAIRKKLGIANWAVFGHSNGAATAVTYALRHPGATRALVLCGPLLSPRDLEANMANKVAYARPGERERVRAVFQSGESLQKRFEAIFGALEPGWQARMMAHNPAGYDLLEAMQAELRQELGGKSLMAPQLVAGLFESGFFTFDAFAHAQKLKMPILVLVGRVDKELSIDNSVLFSASVPDGRLVAVEDAGHFPYIEAPAPTLSAIETFLEGLPKG